MELISTMKRVENLNRYLKKYPADKHVIYAHYLISVIYFEQISDEKKDLEPLLKAKEKDKLFSKYLSGFRICT